MIIFQNLEHLHYHHILQNLTLVFSFVFVIQLEIICIKKVQYIQKDGMKVIFHTDTRDYETYSSFKKILPQLPHQFVQCHKSYIVNTKKITDVDVI